MIDPDSDSPIGRSVTTIEELESIYGEPAPSSLVKELDRISDHYRAFIEKAPFVAVATVGPEGLDCSPRGDPPGFVRVVARTPAALDTSTLPAGKGFRFESRVVEQTVQGDETIRAVMDRVVIEFE